MLVWWFGQFCGFPCALHKGKSKSNPSQTNGLPGPKSLGVSVSHEGVSLGLPGPEPGSPTCRGRGANSREMSTSRRKKATKGMDMLVYVTGLA